MFSLFRHLLEGLKDGWAEWREARYKAHKWATARCAECGKGFSHDEGIYEGAGPGFRHRECHYKRSKAEDRFILRRVKIMLYNGFILCYASFIPGTYRAKGAK